jgi:hypothetical protein
MTRPRRRRGLSGLSDDESFLESATASPRPDHVSIPPRRSMTVPASEEAVEMLGLKKGIRVVAIDLSRL